MTGTTHNTTNDVLHHRIVDSPVGPLTVIASTEGLVAILWPNDPEGRVKVGETTEAGPGHAVLDATEAQLDEYFANDRTHFDLPLDLRGTEFQVMVWNSLASIPFGETVSYGEQASRIGRPKASRAVGAANGKNPVSIVLPCHRVVGSNGALTGFAAGIDAKRFLLDHEQGVATLL